MAHDFLSDFLTTLQGAGELVRVTDPVDPALEIAAVTEQVTKSSSLGGPALLFENVTGSSFPLVTNLLGSSNRLCLALGVDSLDQITDRMARPSQADSPGSSSTGWLEAMRLTPAPNPSPKISPRTIKTAVCQQVVKLGRDVNLWTLPIPRCWPGEANAVITAAHTITQSQVTTSSATGIETKERRVCRVPLQVIGETQIVPHWHRDHDGWRHWQEAARAGRHLQVAMALGGDPLLTLATAYPISCGTDDLVFAGLLRGSGIELVKGRTIDMDVPAGADFVIEGYIDTAAPLCKAPVVAGSTGHYTLMDELPVIHITAVTHRANPVLPVVVPGPPPCEESWISMAVARMLVPVAKGLAPEIVDLHRPFAGSGRHLLFVSIRKTQPHQARRVLNSLWGHPHFGQTKLIVVVDADVNVSREQDVWYAVASNVHPGRDTVTNLGPGALDDHASTTRGVGHALGIDATKKLPAEGHPRVWPQELTMPDDVTRRAAGILSTLPLPIHK